MLERSDRIVQLMEASNEKVNRITRKEIAKAIYPEGGSEKIVASQPDIKTDRLADIFTYLNKDTESRLFPLWDMCTDKLKAYLAVRGEFLSTLLDADTIQELLKAHPNLIQQILSSSPILHNI